MSKLTGQDVQTLRDIRALRGTVKRDTREGEMAYRTRLWALERALSEAGRDVYLTWPSDKVTEELKRWRSAYKLVRTRNGYTAYRWIGRRRDYARHAIACGLDEAAAASFRGLVRV